MQICIVKFNCLSFGVKHIAKILRKLCIKYCLGNMIQASITSLYLLRRSGEKNGKKYNVYLLSIKIHVHYQMCRSAFSYGKCIILDQCKYFICYVSESGNTIIIFMMLNLLHSALDLYF